MDESAGVRPIHASTDVPETEESDSFRIPKQEEREWVQERASGNLQRAPSVKGSSQRLLKAKNPSVIGLPKVQTCGYTASCGIRPSNQRKNSLFFPSHPPPRGKNGRVVLPEKEPLSPKVSCMGSLDLKPKDQKESKDRPKHPPAAVSSDGGGVLRRLRAKCCRGKKAVVVDCSNPKPAPKARGKSDISAAVVPKDETATPASVPPGLGAMKKFASCRKSALVAGVLDSHDDPAKEEASSLAPEPPGLGTMKKFASHRKSASVAGVVDFDDDDDDLEIRSTGLRYQMDLHVADRPAGHRRDAPCN